ncbi:hypothetical protein Tco_0830574 [Tanacetum coccineum]
MAKIQEVLPEESSSTEQPLEQVQNHDENNVFANERQHSENNTVECADERAALANLIANLTLDTEENTRKDIDIKEGQLKEKSKVISDLKIKEEKDIDKMIEMDKQLKFLNEIVYTRNQSIQTIHMLAPKCSTYNGRPTFANPRYLKKAQSDKPCLYEIPYDTFDPANRFAPDREETTTLEKESRSKLNKDIVKLSNHHPKPILISWNTLKQLGRQCGENRLLEQSQTLLKTLPFYPFQNPLVKVDKFLTK